MFSFDRQTPTYSLPKNNDFTPATILLEVITKLISFQPRQKRHFAPIIGAVTYLGAVAHDIVGHIENPFMDTFRDQDGRINIHGNRHNEADLYVDSYHRGNIEGKIRGNVRGNVRGNIRGDTDVNIHSNAKTNVNGNGVFNLHFGLGRRSNDGMHCSQTIYVPIDELCGIDNASNFPYQQRYAVFCV